MVTWDQYSVNFVALFVTSDCIRNPFISKIYIEMSCLAKHIINYLFHEKFEESKHSFTIGKGVLHIRIKLNSR